ncbi:phage tail protein [Escherichia coli]|nr:phage tail protein [Escherichia coli]EFO3053541.1 phage tail protein [Escherichia coli O32]ELZ1457159.1 phage tail protein [Shigella sonnei]DAG44172.1 MAG TPA: Baseplate wedge protein [Caudoviricetes sp.]EFE8228583.1 phage tail protein [Escherichia coli]EFH7192213.1 phage tail protein [Escherichia coli]
MTVKYYAILTNQGAARLANATMLGSKLNLTQMAVGDANGVLPTPDPAQTKLINQKRIAPLNILSVDPNNQSQIIAEQIIPENEGGFWIREIGLYDDEGVLIAVANCPETYKPQLQEGSGRTQTIRMILVVTNTEAITLKIDPSVVLATRKYVDDEVLELRLYVDEQMRNHIAAQDPHTQYAQKHNPTFTGEPKAPTPAAGNNTTRIATTAFVQAAITALINGAPATLDTLKEIAAAINNDPKFSTTINNALSGKQPLDETLTHLSGKDVGAYTGVTAKWLHTKDPKPQKQKVKLKRKKKEKHLRALEHPKAKPVRQKKAPKVPEAREGEYMAGEADNVFALTTVYATKAQAMRAAQAKWDKLQRGVAEFSIILATGRADIYTETPVRVSGFKRVIDEQDWTITKVTHFLNNSGFTTSLELEVRLSDVEYETEDDE